MVGSEKGLRKVHLELSHCIEKLTDTMMQQYEVSREHFDTVLKHEKTSYAWGKPEVRARCDLTATGSNASSSGIGRQMFAGAVFVWRCTWEDIR